MYKHAVIPAVAVVLGLSTAPAAAVTATYTCRDGTELHVDFARNMARVSVKGTAGAATLTQQMAADGFWYTNQKSGLRGKGTLATWTNGSRAATECKAD
ncbi:MliC family protein [Chelatococcus sp. GCM10030263]|uniref:MliC family protein n=1 Tax=Chelatococcus sp. GCM10030263 TaxID=3273387 RepID=UPI00360F9FE7